MRGGTHFRVQGGKLPCQSSRRNPLMTNVCKFGVKYFRRKLHHDALMRHVRPPSPRATSGGTHWEVGRETENPLQYIQRWCVRRGSAGTGTDAGHGTFPRVIRILETSYLARTTLSSSIYTILTILYNTCDSPIWTCGAHACCLKAVRNHR